MALAASTKTPALNTEAEPERAWFCLHSRPKHEHIVGAHLRRMEGVEVFLPRIRFQRATRKGLAWVTEALFPGYLFVRFDWKVSMRQVQSVSGSRGLVHFGNQWPVVSEQTMEELRQAVGPVDLHTINPELAEGDEVRVADGTLRGLKAIVSRIMPGRERVAVLMNLLGRETTVEIDSGAVLKEGDSRREILS
jgi:transcriptional antiterminator RfaH